MIRKLTTFKQITLDTQIRLILNALNNNKKETPTFLNSVTNYNTSTHEAAAYIKTAVSEIVYIMGVVTLPVGFVAGSSMFTLPVGYRPLLKNTFCVINLAGGTVQVDVANDGNVISNTGGNISISLCGIHFIAEQ